MPGFEQFAGRVVFRGTLTARTGLHIGVGRGLGPTGSDLPVIRDFRGRPFIPGSSLKGVLRANLEAWLRGLFPERWREFACDRTSKPELTCRADQVRKQAQTDGRSGADLDEAIRAASCWICGAFGSPWIASKVRIADLPVREPWRPEWLTVRSGVVIDRETETSAADRHLLYDLEVVPAGTAFDLEAVAENAEEHELGLLAVGFDLLDRGLATLGGGASRGLGRVEVELTEIEEVSPAMLVAALRPGSGAVTTDGRAPQGLLAEWKEQLALAISVAGEGAGQSARGG